MHEVGWILFEAWWTSPGIYDMGLLDHIRSACESIRRHSTTVAERAKFRPNISTAYITDSRVNEIRTRKIYFPRPKSRYPSYPNEQLSTKLQMHVLAIERDSHASCNRV